MSPAARWHAGQRIFLHISRSMLLSPGSRVALYVAAGSECDVSQIQALAHARGCRVYLPRIVDYARFSMQLTADRGCYTLSRHRIAEPTAGSAIAPRAASVIFLPLLGFTAQGLRIGSGAGYYDRLLAFHRERTSGARPLLIGVGYQCQRIEHLQSSDHDVPLDAVVTENGLLHCQWKKNS